MSPSQTIAVTTRHGRPSVPTEHAQGVSCKKKRRKQLLLNSETFLKNTVYYRDLQADLQDMLHYALSMNPDDFKSADMLRRFSDRIWMDAGLKKRTQPEQSFRQTDDELQFPLTILTGAIRVNEGEDEREWDKEQASDKHIAVWFVKSMHGF